ncbi:SusC/RagA family TonB-linked outer membrane protein [Muricauda sp. 334s03]|uniref:SusC/RagA family TonB-linked outer membrane protein n=1 Tax=Flagellimonas yonaguniensis TaxID=3031325 RepID=A0ABT5Y0M2_9FLAO|nr:SusC/RagA family TonB-linked outer membrane protein [[Muricauda] yonaguniensis]MDF0716989.1 SusC/RagA family TonB-linked outer membrane protein [[Muricauda] yonaguniensis]
MKKSPQCFCRTSWFLLLYIFLSPWLGQELVAANSLYPWQATISGIITDTDGFPLAGVNVVVDSSNKGTISDMDGSYSIQAGPDDKLAFSMVGFKSLTIPVAGRGEISIQLEEDVTVLGEVVLNAGYYTVSEKERTGSIAKVTSVDIEKQPISNPLAGLQGRAAGVEIVQTSGLAGSNFNIRIRGRNSIRSDGNEPLYIVDGVPYSSASLGEIQASVALPGEGISPLNNINPTDIESIEILKDADATAIYGSRGANGVVLITTKKGGDTDTKVEVSLLTGLGRTSSNLDLMGTAEYLEMRREAYANDGITEYPSASYDVNGTWDQTRETNWQKELFGRTSYLNNVQVSVSGGDGRTNFLVSGNYHKQTSVFPGDYKNDKVSVLANVGHRSMDNRLTLQLSSTYTSNNNDLPGDGLLVLQSYYLAPNAPELYNGDGSLNWENSTWVNPLSVLERDYRSKASTLIGNLSLAYKLWGGLTLKANLGYTESHLYEINTTPSTIYDPVYGAGPQYSSALFNNGKRNSWIVEPQLDFQKDLGDLRLSALAGLTFQEQKSERMSQYAYGFASNKLIENLSAASSIYPGSDENQTYRYHAIYGRVNLGFKERYFLNLSGRRDGSSRFGPDRRFAGFGAIGAAWVFSEENFLKGVSLLSFGKLRTTYGTSGNDQIGDYQYLDTYSFGSLQYQGVSGLYPTRLFNPFYSWEQNRKLEFALDLGLFNDRIVFNGSYYKNRSSNQLVGIPLPATTGFASINGNLDAEVENTGWEFTVNTIIVRTNKFRWDTGFNITLPKNRLIAFPNLEGSTYANQLVIGEPLNIAQRFQLNGVDSDTGLYSFEDFNGDGLLTSAGDRGVLLDLNPKYYGGLSNQVNIGRLGVDLLFQFTKQLGENLWSRSSLPGEMANQPRNVLQRWQQLGDDVSFQRYSTGTPEANAAFQNFGRSDASISDASFIRLKNVSITYLLTEKQNQGFSCLLFLRGQNLITWTNYLGLDPETRNPLAVPSLRMVTLGTRLTF